MTSTQRASDVQGATGARQTELGRAATTIAFLWALLLSAGSLGCGSGSAKLEAPTHAASDAGGAGSQSTDAGVDDADTEADGAVPSDRITVPSPLVSIGKTVVAGPGVDNPEGLVDGQFHGSNGPCSFGLPTADAPAWAAVQVGAGPTRLLAIWWDAGWTEYETLTGGAPLDYRIETSGNSTDGSDGDWDAVVAVSNNPVRNRAHSLGFSDKSWLRLVVIAAPEGSSGVELDELRIHDISASGDALPQDSWLFMGDSITHMAFDRELPYAEMFDGLVSARHPEFHPAMVNGGIGGLTAADGAARVNQWLSLNPDLSHVAIGYGTNDAWGNHDPVQVGFDENMESIVTAVIDAGRVPVLARVPYATAAHETLDEFNAIIDDLQQSHSLPPGPDLYAWFQDHPEELASDGVHPTRNGERSINRLWAEAVDPLYPAP